MLKNKPLELTPGRVMRRGQGHDLLDAHYFEAPSSDPDAVEVWVYTPELSYTPGETVEIHGYTTADTISIEIVKDGAAPETVFSEPNVKGQRAETPERSYVEGCNWPVLHRWTIPDDAPSGGYLLIARCDVDGVQREQHHFFAVRPKRGDKTGRLLLVCATNTWTAYNEWGGCNNYWLGDPDEGDMSVKLSIERPWSRGFIWLPVGAPRNSIDYKPEQGAAPRYPNQEYAFTYGFSRYYAAAGWAMYERQFLEWAEGTGYAVDVITQLDVHFRPEILSDYACTVLVGHDEYYTWEMRDTLEAYVANGGNIARFAGNFVWQIRFEDEGKTQVCYKEKAETEDPVVGTDKAHLMTGPWEHKIVSRPGASTLGLNGLSGGIYAKWPSFTPRASGGFTVYRQDHWAFEGTDLYYGDVFGDEATIFGYETDGVDHIVKHGLPIPTGEDGAPTDLQIIAMGLTSAVEEDHGNPGTKLFDGLGTATLLAEMLHGEATPETIEKVSRGAGMIGVLERGDGTIFNAGTCEWVNGLRLRDRYTEQVTRNVLDRFLSKAPADAKGDVS